MVTYAPLAISAAAAFALGPIGAFKAVFLGCMIAGGLGAYRLAELYGARPWTAAVIAAWYACSPVAFNKLVAGHVNAWFSLAVLPYLFCAIVRSSRGETGLKIWATIAFCLAVTASQPGVFALNAVILGAWALTARSASKAAAVALCIVLGAATQLLPAVELIRAAQEHSVSELLPRLPWEVGNSISFERALALRSQDLDYIGIVHPQFEPFLQYLFASIGVIAAGGLLTIRQPGERALWVAAAVFILLAATSMHTFVRPLAEWAFLRDSRFSIFREWTNFLEVLSVCFAAGLAALSARFRMLGPFVTIAAAAGWAAVASAPLDALAPMPLLEAQTQTAASVAALPQTDRVWPLPNGRFVQAGNGPFGGYDPFSGHLGSHAVAEEYFSTGPEAYARTLPIERSLPLLQAMAVGIIWNRPWFWKAPESKELVPPPQRPEQERIGQAPLALTAGKVAVVPDAWPLGVSALTGGEHFIFAEDAAALGFHEQVQPPFDDRRLTDSHLGPVNVRLGDQSRPETAAFANDAVEIRQPALHDFRFTGNRLVLTDGTPDTPVSVLGRVGRGRLYGAACEPGHECAIEKASFAIVGGPIEQPVFRTMPLPMNGRVLYIDRSLFTKQRRAIVDGHTLVHVRADGYANGWLAEAGDVGRIQIVDSDAGLLGWLRIATLAPWLIIAGAMLWPGRASKGPDDASPQSARRGTSVLAPGAK